MNIEHTQCCAVQEIGNLSHHASAEEAMVSFCRALTDYDYGSDDFYIDRWGNERDVKPALPKPAGFYIFTGVVKHTWGEPPPQRGQYAPRFAAYILRHKLGSVVETHARPNRCNHPNHLVKVYVWHPSERNLRKWWRQHGS